MAKSGKNLIQIVNELQDKLQDLGVESLAIDLPQIAVIGGQSAGKSSVLESFVGRDFLPRGSGIVTRRPLVLQLINNKVDTNSYGEFLHLPAKRFVNFDEIRDEIVAETDREVRDSTGISPKPIHLKIHSPDVLDLTLVDLPGLTRVAVGSQPKDIENRVENMILEYIRRDNCLILAVTSATQDLATSDALKLAERVDPKGERTIGILTKLDRLELGSDARDILTGNYGIHLKRGFIGVVNRSQRDIDEKKDMKEALDKEYQFFSQHPAYKDISDRLGISYLQQYLHQELSKHIYKLLPPLKHRFELELSELTAKLEAISEPLVESDKEIILSKTNEELRKNFESAVGGNGSGNGNDVDIKKLNGGAKINVIMNDTYGNEVNQLFTDEHQMRHDIHVAIQNIKGVYMCIFPPDAAFKACVISQIELLRKPSLVCVESVAYELQDIVRDCIQTIQTFTPIKEFYTRLTLDYVVECKKRCKACVEHLIRVEKAYLNTNNDDFMKLYKESGGMAAKIAAQESTSSSDKPNDTISHTDNMPFTLLPEDVPLSSLSNTYPDDGPDIPAHMKTPVEHIKRFVDAYVVLLKKKFRDHLPKLITLELMDATKDFITMSLRVCIRDHIHTIDDICGEDPDEDLRNDLQNRLKHYSEAIDILNVYREDWSV